MQSGPGSRIRNEKQYVNAGFHDVMQQCMVIRHKENRINVNMLSSGRNRLSPYFVFPLGTAVAHSAGRDTEASQTEVWAREMLMLMLMLMRALT
jgi:hypothetical protein